MISLSRIDIEPAYSSCQRHCIYVVFSGDCLYSKMVYFLHFSIAPSNLKAIDILITIALVLSITRLLTKSIAYNSFIVCICSSSTDTFMYSIVLSLFYLLH